MENNLKNILLELECNKDNEFIYIDKDIIDKIIKVFYSNKQDYLIIDFITTYNKPLKFITDLNNFKNWAKVFLKKDFITNDIFKVFLENFFETSSENTLKEIIDDTNEIIPDDDMPSNATNAMVGGKDQTMDLEKIFKRSMPKSVRNYSGNLGLGTVVW